MSEAAERPTLRQLHELHRTERDAEWHTRFGVHLCDRYDKLLSPRRDQVRKVLEIGVRWGAGARMWRDYFPDAQIWGLDIDPRSKCAEAERIHVVIGDQGNREALQRLATQAPPFDLVIDDGSHHVTDIRTTFWAVFPFMAPGGLYIVEDLWYSYYPEWEPKFQQHPAGRPDRREFDAFVQRHVWQMDHGRGQVASLHFWPSVLVVEKTGGRYATPVLQG
jgi:cephalosporin hydroxylase